MAALMDQVNQNIVSESAAYQASLDGAAAIHRSRYEAGVAATEQAMQRHEAGLDALQHGELQLANRERQLVSEVCAEI